MAREACRHAQAPHSPGDTRLRSSRRAVLRHRREHDDERHRLRPEAHTGGHRHEVCAEDPGHLSQGPGHDNNALRHPLRKQGLRGRDGQRRGDRDLRVHGRPGGPRLQLRREPRVPGRGQEEPREVRAHGLGHSRGEGRQGGDRGDGGSTRRWWTWATLGSWSET